MNSSVPAALQDQRLAVVDVEGNGRHPAEIIEIAVLPVDESPVRGEDMRSWLIRPEQPISQFVTRQVHGITNEDVAGYPPWQAIAGEVEAILTGRVLVAHSAAIEHRVLGAHLPTWQPPVVLDTLRLAKYVWPELDSYGLDRLIKYAHLDTGDINDQRYHRARYDAWCAWQLLLVLVAESGLGWAELVRAAALPGAGLPEETEGELW